MYILFELFEFLDPWDPVDLPPGELYGYKGLDFVTEVLVFKGDLNLLLVWDPYDPPAGEKDYAPGLLFGGV